MISRPSGTLFVSAFLVVFARRFCIFPSSKHSNIPAPINSMFFQHALPPSPAIRHRSSYDSLMWTIACSFGMPYPLAPPFYAALPMIVLCGQPRVCMKITRCNGIFGLPSRNSQPIIVFIVIVAVLPVRCVSTQGGRVGGMDACITQQAEMVVILVKARVGHGGKNLPYELKLPFAPALQRGAKYQYNITTVVNSRMTAASIVPLRAPTVVTE